MNSGKQKARELAMQVLFVWDTQGSAEPQLAQQVIAGASVETEIVQLALGMAGAAWEKRAISDAWVERLAPQWPVRRQPGVDRSLLRLGVWELTCTDTPPRVVIDQAIELAKEFSTQNSAAFVNGVLDAVLHEHEAAKKSGPVAEDKP